MPIIDPVALYIKMQGEVPDIGDEVSTFHDNEVQRINAERRKEQDFWNKEHNH